MKYLLFALLLWASINAHGFGPKTLHIKDFFPDAKFIGIVKILSGVASGPHEKLDSCSVKYSAEIERPILGGKKGEKLSLHLMIDYRFSPLEVGSRYFVYAEDRESHRFVTLADVIDLSLNDKRPEFCHSSDSLYLYREFTHKVFSERGFEWIGDMHEYEGWRGIRQVEEVRKQKQVYNSLKAFPPGGYYIGEPGNYEDDIIGSSPELNAVMKVFEKHYKKYLKTKRRKKL